MPQVGSSIIAAWADISSAFNFPAAPGQAAGSTIGGINVGYMWMALNCLASAAYVSANESAQ